MTAVKRNTVAMRGIGMARKTRTRRETGTSTPTHLGQSLDLAHRARLVSIEARLLPSSIRHPSEIPAKHVKDGNR